MYGRLEVMIIDIWKEYIPLFDPSDLLSLNSCEFSAFLRSLSKLCASVVGVDCGDDHATD
jgi:hypothetical protein